MFLIAVHVDVEFPLLYGECFGEVLGETLTMLVSEEENGGACQPYEVHLPPYRPSPPLHYHLMI